MSKAKRNRCYTERQKKFIQELKSNPCVDCGKRFHFCVMDFDHRNQFIKQSGISRMISHYGRATILKEISKCDLVCSNCHRLRTYRRLVL
jgi:hypothetical protein